MNTAFALLAVVAVLGPSGEKVCDVTPPALPQGARIETTNLENAAAWRIRFDGVGERRITDEGWVFDFGADLRCWPVSHAQGEYVPKTLSTISQMAPRPDFAPVAAGIGEMHNYATHFPGTAESPLVVEGPGFVAAIGDAGCLDYARIRFASGEKPGTVKTVLEGETFVKVPYVTPWRYIHVAKDAAALANAQPALMDALNAPSRIADTSWIKPGKVLRVAKLDTDCGKAAVDFVKRNNMQYIELDCGWYGQEHIGDPLKPGLAPERVAKGEKFDLFEILRYAKEKDVGVILYVNREPLKKNRDAILDQLVKWGVKGVKYGFVNVGNQEWRKWVTDAIAAAADRELLVDIHDEYRLTGIQKTYPNVMTVEGICGNEEMPNAAHDCALPFTRFLDGPGDYTPCWNNGRVKNTLAHQLALPCVYTSGWQFLFWYSRPDQIPEKDPALDFWRELPASFDETRFLQGEIGKFAVVARRKGHTWYVAGINGLERRAFTMDTSFLGAGEWKCRLFRDDDPAIESGLGKVTVESVPVAPTMKVEAAARGGFAAIFEPSREAWRGADVMNRAVQFPLDAVSLDGGPLKERQDVDTSYLLDVVDADRLLAEFRRIAGLPAKAVRYPNRWEGGQINGHSLGHYLSSVSALCAVASDPDIRRRAKAKVDYVVSELAACQKANGDGYLMTCPKEIYDKVRSGDFTAGGFDINKWWVPNYTLHKVMAGLRDACRCAKNRTALEVERKLADWYIGVVADLSDADIQRLLISEWGGLNETFANLYDDTGDVKYRDAAERFFDDRRIFDPLKRGEDRLDGRHANTQVPKMAGLARLYEQTGKPEYRTAVETFWKSVVLERSFVTGGHSDNEHFHPVRDNVKRLGPHNGETCNVNNMLRLTAHVFGWEPRSSQMDFVECALYNHLSAQIGRNPGEFGYFLSLAPVAEKVWSTPEGAWWCCVGTGMENPMHYAEHAYYRSADEETLYVNLFMPTTLTWAEKGVKVVQTTQFPRSDEVLLEISSASPVRFTLKIRRPAWIGKDGVVFGELPGGEDPVPEDDGYYTISREWRDGDKIRFRLPMELRKVPLPHSDGRRIAFARGPLVMAGIMPPEKGKRDLAKERWDDHLAAPGRTDEASMVLMEGDGIYLRPHGLEFMPLMDVYEEHYTVYFPVMSEAEWAREAKRLEEERVRAAELAARLVDEVWPGFQQSEVNHDIVHEHSSTGDAHGLKYRHGEGPDALFGYTLAVDDAEACELVVRYWGGDLGRVFDIAVDGTVLCRETIDAPAPGRVFEKSYPLPLEVTRGKKKISVAFKGCEKTHFTAGVYHVAVRRMKMADKEKFEAAETLSSPDGRLSVAVGCSGGAASYAVYLEGAEVISPSPLGIVADFADLSRGLAVERAERDAVDEEYSVPTLKSGHVRVTANRMKMFFTNSVGRCAVAFHVSDRDVSFRYEIPAQCGRRSVRVLCEKTGFSFPDGTTGFMSPQTHARFDGDSPSETASPPNG